MFSNYRAAAQRLGFTMYPADPGLFDTSVELSGTAEGHPVRIRRIIGMHELDTEVYLQPGLDLGLDVSPAGQMSWAVSALNLRRIGRLFSRADLQIGDAELDDAFAIHGDEDVRVRALLEAARAALLGWYRSEVAFDVNDARVRVRRYSYTPATDSVGDILADLGPALALARQLEAARPQIPPAAALAPHVEGFRAFAAEHRLGFMTTPLAVWGSLPAGGFWARATRIGARQYQLEATLAPVPGITLRGNIIPATALSGARVAATGDGAFDEAFAVDSPGFARLLAPEARQALLALRAAGNVVAVGEFGVALHGQFGSVPYPLERVAGLAETALRSLVASVRSNAAYR